jgi:hypothetical protein
VDRHHQVEEKEMDSYAIDDLRQFIERIKSAVYPSSADLERWESELESILTKFVDEAVQDDVLPIVKGIDDRLAKIEAMVETVAKEVGPIVADLANSPVIKMLTGGKKA